MKKKVWTVEDYRAIGRDIRGQILGSYSADSCIATTAATVDILKSIAKIDAYPLAVEVAVVNGVLFDRAEELERFPELGSGEYPEGGYGVLVGHPSAEPVPGRWPGHLVAVAERRWMLDFSIDQASRPDQGIELVPLAVPVTEAFLRGKVAHLVYRWGNTRLYYSARPKDKSFVRTANWSGETRPKIILKEEK